MEDSIATAPRYLLHIKRRHLTEITYRAARKLAKTVDRFPETSSSYMLYPAVESREYLGDLVNRLAWYFPPESTAGPQITIPRVDELDVSQPLPTPESQHKYTREHLSIEYITPTDVPDYARSTDCILCHDFYSAWDVPFVWNLARTRIVDPNFYSVTECVNWPAATDDCRTNVSSESRKNFERLEQRAESVEKAYVFATGPSLERAYEFDFDPNDLSIVCNSMVRNQELLAHIDPDLLVFADPVFHFGPSKYAHEFREDAVDAVETFDCLVAVPAKHMSLLSGHYPELADRLIGIEPVDSDIPLFPTRESIEVKGTGNIMTLMMLPFASSLSDEVYVIGADGREETASYFWEHSDVAQYDDEMMQTAVDTHPSFFRDRVYTDYYEEHVETLTDMIEYGERQGIGYASLTESHIDCLQKRHDPDARPEGPESEA